MAAKVVGPRDGKAGFLGSIGVRFIIDGAEAGERLSFAKSWRQPVEPFHTIGSAMGSSVRPARVTAIGYRDR